MQFQEDDLLDDQQYQSVLSRRDLSANNDDGKHSPLVYTRTPRDFFNDLPSGNQ